MFFFDLGLVLKKIQEEVKIWLEWIFDPHSSENDSDAAMIPIPVAKPKRKDLLSFWGISS